MHSISRIRGRDRAAAALTAFTDRLAIAPLPELQTFRRTLLRWRNEILAYFDTGLTNGRTEGFNNKAKLVKIPGSNRRHLAWENENSRFGS